MVGLLPIMGVGLLTCRSWQPARITPRLLNLAWLTILTLVITVFAAVTVVQSKKWNPQKFWADALEQLPQYSTNVQFRPYVDILLNQSRQLLESNEIDQVFGVFRDYFGLPPVSEISSGNFGDVSHVDSRLATSREELRRAIDKKPTLKSRFLTNLGIAYAKSGRPDQAVRWFQEAAEIDPTAWYAYQSLGIATASMDKLDEAIYYFQKAIDLNPMCASCYNGLGLAQQDSGNIVLARESFYRALKIQPSYTEASKNLELLSPNGPATPKR